MSRLLLFLPLLLLGTLVGCDAVDPGPSSGLDAAGPASASGSNDTSAQGEVEHRGPIEALGTDRFTVRGTVFVVSASTRLLDRNNRPISFSALAVGTVVEAEGVARSNGTVAARKVKLEDGAESEGDDDGAEVRARGPIQTLGATSLTVRDQLFATDAQTRYLDRNNQPVGREAFHVGSRVEVEGHLRADGSARAEKVKMED